MNVLLPYGRAFLMGGLLCLIGQLLIDYTGLTPARILTSYVVAGAVLGALGLYEPLTGFGSAIARGVRQAVAEKGFLGVFSGEFTAASAGLGAAVLAGLIVSLLGRPKDKGEP